MAGRRAQAVAVMKRVWQEVAPFKAKLWWGAVALLGAAGINLALPAVIRWALRDEGAVGSAVQVPLLFGVFVGLFALQAFFFYIRSYLFGVVGHEVANHVRTRAFRALMARPVSFFDDQHVGDLVSRLGADTQLLQDVVSVRLSVVIRYALQVAAGAALMMYLSWRLSILLLLVLPILVGISALLARRLRRCSRVQQEALGRASALAEETLLGIRVVRAFNQQQPEALNFGRSVEQVLQAGRERTAVSAFFQSFVSFILNAALAGIAAYGLWLSLEGSLSFADLSAFVLYGLIVGVSFSFLAGGVSDLIQAIAAAERVFNLVDNDSLNSLEGSGSVPVQRAWSGAGSVRFERISFSYPVRADVRVLDNVSFDVPAGQTTALVGPSGSGKSTLVALLLGFYVPSEGRVLIDDRPLETLSPAERAALVSFVPQEPTLFSRSIADNLRFGAPHATQAELRQVCADVRLLDYIDSLPQGFDTPLGQQGARLSAGQRQRLAIARALLRDPLILVLDEATASLDSENEAFVQEALSRLRAGRTALVIAHRLSTIQSADQIVVLNRGEVVQYGPPRELSEEEGLYKQLLKYQMLPQESPYSNEVDAA